MERSQAVIKNLLALKDDEQMLSECRSAHLREAALLFLRSTPDQSADFDLLRENYEAMRDSLSAANALGAADRMTLCRHISDSVGARLSDEGLMSLFLQAEEGPESPVICYLRNPISDLAYTEFVREKPGAGVLYADSFQAVCENLIGQESDYAILPIVSGNDGRLSRFEAMISSYGFVISAVASVTHNHDAPPDRFALLSRSPEIPRKPDAGEILCLKLSVPSSANCAALISAAARLGAILREAETLYQDSRKSFSFVFEITNARLAALLTYLTLEEGGFVTNGLYIPQKTPD